MLASRRDVSKLTEVAACIESYHKGLYPFLMRLHYTADDFEVGTTKIQALD